MYGGINKKIKDFRTFAAFFDITHFHAGWFGRPPPPVYFMSGNYNAIAYILVTVWWLQKKDGSISNQILTWGNEKEMRIHHCIQFPGNHGHIVF